MNESYVKGNNRAVIYDAKIGNKTYRNFSGVANECNSAGSRNFVVFLDPDFAHVLEGIEAPVQWKPNKYNNNELRPQMKVHVKYRDRYGNPMIPPKVVTITDGVKTELTEDTIGTLDFAEFENVNMVLDIYPNKGTVGPKNCCSLKTLYATIATDELAALYNGSNDN